MKKNKISKILNESAQSDIVNAKVKKEKELNVLENEINNVDEKIENLFSTIISEMNVENKKK